MLRGGVKLLLPSFNMNFYVAKLPFLWKGDGDGDLKISKYRLYSQNYFFMI